MKTIFLQLIKKYEDGKGYILSIEFDDNSYLHNNNYILMGLEKSVDGKHSYLDFYYDVAVEKASYRLVLCSRFN
jgi:hypothetical protein